MEYYFKGSEEFDKRNYLLAIEYFELSNKIEEHFKTYERLFQCWKELSNTKQAFACIEKAYILNPKNDKTAYEFAEMVVESGNNELAQDILQSILQRNPTYKKVVILYEKIRK